jgi:hypothetical protein
MTFGWTTSLANILYPSMKRSVESPRNARFKNGLKLIDDCFDEYFKIEASPSKLLILDKVRVSAKSKTAPIFD